MVILSSFAYDKIISEIRNFNGLTIDCDKYLQQKYPEYDKRTLSSILSREGQGRLKATYPKILQNISYFLKEYENAANIETNSDEILLKMSIKVKFSPIGLSRLILGEKYKNRNKVEVSEMLRNPHLIPDKMLAVNVSKCLFNDNLDGPITDLIRRFIGEEYEIRLKQKAKEAGLVFYDEGDLRRTGYDKTPDLKLAIPCLYKGTPIHWIESKASFGDMESHQKYTRDQLLSYGNRFGAGIVIYWLGFLDKITECIENSNIIFITDSFPDLSELELLNVDLTNK